MKQSGNAKGVFLKRLFDLLVAVILMSVISPLFMLLAILVRLRLGGPVFFRQVRPGLNGELFTIYKFRSMTDERDRQGNLLPNAQRLTSFGRFIRATSLDELPALLNVIKGEMSLVGPRPLLPKYLDRYSPFQARRHEVLPGITGWAQVNGRNALSWEDKFTLDVWYVDNRSFFLDCKILFLTFYKVIRRDGINHDGKVGMTEFLGTEKQ